MNKKTINNILSFLSVLAIGVATVYVLSLISPSTAVKTATAPVVELPSNATTTNPEGNLTKLLLNTHPYTPSPDVLSSLDSYKAQSIRLILNGEFQDARLHIVGNVTEKGDHFFNIVYGNVGGTLNAYRQSPTTLNTTLTQQSGGVFTNDNPIDVTLDLLNPIQLAATRTEYEKNQQTSKMVNLWQSNLLPPTYISLLVVPFNEDGVYGGAQITSTFEYSCSAGHECQAAICPSGELATVCMRDKFGAYVAQDWCRRAGYKSCSF